MKKGQLVYINYIGKLKGTNEVFDTNLEDVAKNAGIYNEKIKYRPLPVIIGTGYIFKKIEDNLAEMKEGEKRNIDLSKEEAFGDRKEELVRQVPMNVFASQGLKPKVGQEINVSGIKGRVINISGGRVTIDFNHPLAGKDLEFEVELIKEAKDTKEKILGIIEIFTANKEAFDVQIEGETIKIFDKERILDAPRVRSITQNIFDWVDGIKKVKFITEFEKVSSQ